jgi:protein-L-isoaspartate(D-aspartate) O-methyltransferase
MAQDLSVRRRMIDGQVRVNDVTDIRIIEAMLKLPRELFVAENAQAQAYLDLDAPATAAGARRLLKPVVAARLIQAAAIAQNDKVLIVGSSTGYMAALTASLGADVHGVESDAALAERSRATLKQTGLDGIAIHTGAVENGDAAHGPYDVIVIDGATEVVPERLLEQLGEGGRLVAVFNEKGRMGARIWTRSGREISARPLFSCGAATVPGLAQRPEFAF